MAVTLPSPDTITLKTPDADRPNVSFSGVEAAGQDLGNAYAKVGQSVSQVGNAMADAQDRVAFAGAYSSFLQQKLDLDQKYQADPDYTTAPQRYADDIEKAAQASAGPIRSQVLRSDFLDRTARMREFGVDGMVRVAHSKAIDADRGFIDDSVNKTVEAASQARDEPTRVQLFQSFSSLVDGYAAKGSITAREAVKIKQSVPNLYAERYFKTLSATDPALAARLLLPSGPPIASSLPTDLAVAIHGASQRYGADEDTLARTAALERPAPGGRVTNATSGATGDFQFIPATARQYGVNALDATSSADGAARLQNDNRQALTESLGRAPTPSEIYLAHQQGAAGASALIMHPDMPAIAALSLAYPNDQQKARAAILNNGGSADMSAADFVDKWTGKFNAVGGIPPRSDVGGAPGTGPSTQPSYDAAGNVIYPKMGDMRDLLRPDQRAILAQQATQHAETLARAAEVDAARQDRLQAKAVQQASDATEDKVIADAMGTGSNPKITATQISDPNGPYKELVPSAKLRMIAFVNRADKPDPAAAVSHQLAINLVGDIRAGKITDMAPIYDAYAKQDADGHPAGLTNGDFNFVQTQFKERQTDDGQRLDQTIGKFFAAVKQSIDKSNPLQGGLDMTGGALFFKLQQDVAAKVAEYRKAGKNPYDLLDPSKPDYVGKPEALDPYQHSILESMAEVTARMERDQNRQSPGGSTPPPAKKRDGLTVDTTAGTIDPSTGVYIPSPTPGAKRPPLDQILGPVAPRG